MIVRRISREQRTLNAHNLPWVLTIGYAAVSSDPFTYISKCHSICPKSPTNVKTKVKDQNPRRTQRIVHIAQTIAVYILICIIEVLNHDFSPTAKARICGVTSTHTSNFEINKYFERKKNKHRLNAVMPHVTHNTHKHTSHVRLCPSKVRTVAPRRSELAYFLLHEPLSFACAHAA